MQPQTIYLRFGAFLHGNRVYRRLHRLAGKSGPSMLKRYSWLLMIVLVSSHGDELSWDESCATGVWKCKCMKEGEEDCTNGNFSNWSDNSLPGEGLDQQLQRRTT